MDFEEYVEGFEEVAEANHVEDIQLSNDENIRIYTVIQMYKKSRVFRSFVDICLDFFARNCEDADRIRRIAEIITRN